jgi:hypothetical protein
MFHFMTCDYDNENLMITFIYTSYTLHYVVHPLTMKVEDEFLSLFNFHEHKTTTYHLYLSSKNLGELKS